MNDPYWNEMFRQKAREDYKKYGLFGGFGRIIILGPMFFIILFACMAALLLLTSVISVETTNNLVDIKATQAIMLATREAELSK